MALTGTTVAGLGTGSRGSGEGGDRTTSERATTGSSSTPERLGFGYGGTALVDSESLTRQTSASAERTSASGIDTNGLKFEPTMNSSTSTPTETPTSTQEPFRDTPATIPGRIQAQYYDTGGEGVAYHETDPQWDGRPESDTLRGDTRVDLQATSDVSGDYNIGRFVQGEWLEYTVEPEPGTYDLELRVATPRDGRQLRIELDGRTLRTVDIPNTGGWNDYHTVTVPDVSIDAARTTVLRIEPVNSGIDVNWLEFGDTEDSPSSAPMTTTPTPTPDSDGDDYAEQGYGEYGYGGIA